MLRVIVNFYDELHIDSGSKLREQLSPIIIKIINGFIVLIGLLHLITLFGVDPTTVLAGASIGGIAVAFAAQDSVKNLIGTINIFLDKPFQIGDWVEIGAVTGIVEKVGLRSTVIRAADTSIFQIPNSKISEADVNNKGLRIYRRYLTELGIRYDTPPELIQGFVVGVRELVKAHPDTHSENYNVEFSGFGDSALNIMINVFFINLEWGHEQSSKHVLHLAIVKLAKSLGVEFAFPSSTVIIEQFPEKIATQMKYETNEKVIRNSISSVLKEFDNDTKLLRADNNLKEIQ
ncbi:MAG: mechanosensitive ion channel family protein [Flavobacteriaceae bacterium]|nr:mechanosensitive ion channel family protein [Flavobacteriaceae bacterium]